ncbi:uncharacterized protein LOC110716074 [Chenopodium quinoa]|uniref:uncharacterized protein LOC110716074 n=1 Tax=Chenopodium quinoa TaxID=63459 RepID=UPI000B78648B|nr:uncharacterized protein LOC110716074 [Chenopodium quinoa]
MAFFETLIDGSMEENDDHICMGITSQDALQMALTKESKGVPMVELKPLPPLLRYEFLGPNSTFPVIVSSSLSENQAQEFCGVLRRHEDKAKEWLRDEGTGSFDTWEKLVKAFLVKFLGQEKTARLRNELSTFRQSDDESLYEAWRRFKRLQRQCPHHGIHEWMLIQTFYNGLTHEFQIYIDVSSGGSLLTKNPTEAKELIEKMALTSKFDRLQAGTFTSLHETCQMCNVQGHIAPNCPQNSNDMSIEEANAFYISNPKRPYDPHSNTYNEGWKNHPNFSYKNTQAQQNPPPPPPRNSNYNAPPGFQPRPPPVQQPIQPPPQKSNLELMLENFITTTNNSIQQQNGSIQQLQAQSKLMENQISQLAHQTEQPQKGHINVVTLRSEKQLEDPPTKEPSREVVEEVGAGEKVIDSAMVEEEPKEATSSPVVPCVPKVPFPHQAKLEKKYGKFLDILKKLHINIPFLDAISEMPSYAKFLKDMLSNKKKLEENATVALTA